MASIPQIKIPAVYMRGGTSKGVFFRHCATLPHGMRSSRCPRCATALLLRAIGSPDPYAKQIDGLGGATSSHLARPCSSRRSTRPDSRRRLPVRRRSPSTAPVDRLVAATAATCRAAVGPVRDRAAASSTRPACRATACATVRIWQANIGKTHRGTHVPMREWPGAVEHRRLRARWPEPSRRAEVPLDFIDPADEGEGGGGGAMFPTGKLDRRSSRCPAARTVKATPGRRGHSRPSSSTPPTSGSRRHRARRTRSTANPEAARDARAPSARTRAVKHGPDRTDIAEAANRVQHTPKLAFVAPPKDHGAASGTPRARRMTIDLLVRASCRWASCTTP
jgi:2-methylaconitate cis-trans-isomerase PrpF